MSDASYAVTTGLVVTPATTGSVMSATVKWSIAAGVIVTEAVPVSDVVVIVTSWVAAPLSFIIFQPVPEAALSIVCAPAAVVVPPVNATVFTLLSTVTAAGFAPPSNPVNV